MVEVRPVNGAACGSVSTYFFLMILDVACSTGCHTGQQVIAVLYEASDKILCLYSWGLYRKGQGTWGNALGVRGPRTVRFLTLQS
jgi:hypothetical protein